MRKLIEWAVLAIALIGCKEVVEQERQDNNNVITIQKDTIKTANTSNTPLIFFEENSQLLIADVNPHELVAYAKSLLGITYKYASIDPAEGFDCSGFITYVFNHYNIAVPRSSVGFTNVGKTIDPITAKEGDLILFTGTVDSIRVVGHMGIVTENTDSLRFIHSTSGKANGVTISPFNDHYKKRFVKIIRVFDGE